MAVKMEREIPWVHVLRRNGGTTVAPAADREILREREEGAAEIKNLKLNKMIFIVK